MKTFYEWFKDQKETESLSEMLILCKQAWYDGQREICLNYDVKEKTKECISGGECYPEKYCQCAGCEHNLGSSVDCGLPSLTLCPADSEMKEVDPVKFIEDHGGMEEYKKSMQPDNNFPGGFLIAKK